MPQIFVLWLLICALVLPVLGAAALRLAGPRVEQGRQALVAGVIFALAAASVLVLARSDVSRIQVAGLSVLLPVAAPADGDVVLPPSLDGLTPAPDPSDEEHAAHDEPTAATPAATPEITATPEPPTATPEPPTPEPPTATPEPAGPQRYTVQAGDTLRSIAEQFGVSVAELLRANDLSPEQADALRLGQELVIP